MLAELIKSFLPKQDRYNDPRYWIELFKAKVGGKYLKRWQVTNPRTGKKSWKYKYKPLSQRGAHEITLGKFKKVTKIADETHKAAVEKALQEGHSISMHILKDYPDLIKKYNKSAKVRNFDRISAKVKEAKQKVESVKQEPKRTVPEKEIPKPSYNTELDKARKEKDPKTKWRNLKAILDKAKAENNVPEGLEQEVREAGKAMLNHALSGEWENKSPKKEINIDSMNPKKKEPVFEKLKNNNQENNFETMPDYEPLPAKTETRASIERRAKEENISTGVKQKTVKDLQADKIKANLELRRARPGESQAIRDRIQDLSRQIKDIESGKSLSEAMQGNENAKKESVQAEEIKTEINSQNKEIAKEKQRQIEKVSVKLEEKQTKRSIKKQDQINRQVRDLLNSRPDNNFTQQEKELLSQYEGDGGQTSNEGSEAKGKGLLYEFYTPQQMIDKTWDIISGYIQPGASVLEPSAGIGKWAKNVKGVKFDMLEIDQTSSRIAKILNPEHNVQNMPFEKMFLDKMNRSVKEYKGKKYNAVVGNPPYGAMTGIYKNSEGKGYKRYENYFMSRSLDTLEEGGILAMVVPSSFLSKDSNDPEKKKIMDKCELLDAYRFPEGAFSNTKIGTDLVILRKNTTGTQDNQQAFGGRFFESNPEKVLGEKKIRKNRFGREETYIEGNASSFINVPRPEIKEMSQAQKDAIAKGLIGNDNAKGHKGATKKEATNKAVVEKAQQKNKIINDAVRQSVSAPVETFSQAEFNVKYQAGFDAVDSLLVSQTNTLGYITDFTGIPNDFSKIAYVDGKYMPHYIYKSGDIKERLKQLENDKDDIISKHGEQAYEQQLSMLQGIKPEQIDIKDITLSPIDSFSQEFRFKTLETQEDYLDSILGKTVKDTGIYRTKEWSRTAGKYIVTDNKFTYNKFAGTNLGYRILDTGKISMQVLDKSGIAVSAGYFDDLLELKKITALIKDHPQWSDFNLDNFKGSKLEQDFGNALEAVKSNNYSDLDIPQQMKDKLTMSEEEISLTQEEGTGGSIKERFFEYVRNLDSDYWGQYNQISYYDVIAYCNKEPVTGKDAEKNQTRRKERREAGERLFKKFINEELNDSEKEQLQRAWNDTFNNKVEIDPKTVPVRIEGLSKTFKGRDYTIKDVQTQFISKFIQKGVGCAAHQVGVGKTMSGIISTVSNMQMGRSKKPVVIVPTSVLQKWEYEFRQLYPNVPLNIVGTKQLNEKLNKDGKFEVADGSVTVMSYDAFERFSFTEEKFKALTDKLQDQIANPNADESEKGKRKKAQESEKAESVAGKAIIGTDSRLLFDKAGFDHITVDEAHNFNNIFTDSASTNAKGRGEANEFQGITGGSASARGMKLWLAARHVLQENNNRNILLLTATPFTNNPLQVYSLISLMAKERLEEMGIYNIREFIAAFVEIGTEFAMEANGQVKEKTTVRSFKNAQAFRKLISEFFDYKTGEDAGIKRPKLKQKSVILPPTQEMIEMRAELEALFDEKDDSGRPLPGAALKSIGNQQIMNISPALVKSTTMDTAPMKGEKDFGTKESYGKQFVERSPKVKFALDSIAKFFKEHKRLRPEMAVPGQLCFLPRGVEFTADMKNYLVKVHGIPADAIGIMTPKEKSAKAKDPAKAADGISQFTEMTEDFNNINGKLKIIIGSDVIKEGVDLNGNTAIAYNLMTAWNPTDEQQKLGRAWRQGNNQENVHFVNIQIEDSIDTKLFQKQAEKASRINDIFADTGSSAIDVSDINPDDLKLDVITDPVRKAQVAVKQEQAKAEAARKEKRTKVLSMQNTLDEYISATETIQDSDKAIAEYNAEWEAAKKEPDYDPEGYDSKYYPRKINEAKKDKASAKLRLDTTIAKKMALYQIPADPKEAQNKINRLSEKIDSETADAKESEKEHLENLIKKFTLEKIQNDKEKAARGKIGLDNIVNAHVQEMLDSVLNQVKKAMSFYKKHLALQKMSRLMMQIADNRIRRK